MEFLFIDVSEKNKFKARVVTEAEAKQLVDAGDVFAAMNSDYNGIGFAHKTYEPLNRAFNTFSDPKMIKDYYRFRHSGSQDCLSLAVMYNMEHACDEFLRMWHYYISYAVCLTSTLTDVMGDAKGYSKFISDFGRRVPESIPLSLVLGIIRDAYDGETELMCGFDVAMYPNYRNGSLWKCDDTQRESFVDYAKKVGLDVVFDNYIYTNCIWN